VAAVLYRKLIARRCERHGRCRRRLNFKQPLTPATVSPDKTVAFFDLQFKVPVDQLTDEDQAALERVAEPARKAGLQVEFSGGVTATSEHASSDEVVGVALAFERRLPHLDIEGEGLATKPT
jgi:hypothetical protein